MRSCSFLKALKNLLPSSSGCCRIPVLRNMVEVPTPWWQLTVSPQLLGSSLKFCRCWILPKQGISLTVFFCSICVSKHGKFFLLWRVHGIRLGLTSQVALVVKNSPANAGDIRDSDLIPGQEGSSENEMATTPIFLPGEFHGQGNLADYRP